MIYTYVLQAPVNNFFLKGATRRRTLRGETLGDGGSCRREDIAGGNTLYVYVLFLLSERR